MCDRCERSPTVTEKRIIERLLSQRLPTEAFRRSLDTCTVQVIDEFGSLRIVRLSVAMPTDSRPPELEASDADGVEVYALLHSDPVDGPRELEIVKADGSPLRLSLDSLSWVSPTEGWPPGWVLPPRQKGESDLPG